MKTKFLYLIFLYLILHQLEAYSQRNCDAPSSPLLKLVSVDPESGNTTINWDLSPSSDIAAYVIYTFSNDAGLPLDTIWNPTATNYIYTSQVSKYYSVSYVVAAHRIPSCTSPLSNHLNTIFSEAEIDTCNRIITVSWNSYFDYPKKVTGYTIMSSENGSGFSPSGDVAQEKGSFIINNFKTDSEYCFYVEAKLEGGSVSKSNKTCLSTKMQRPPDWINADYATVKENKVNLSFTIDPLSEISNFSLEKKTGKNSNYAEIAKLSDSKGTILYTDTKADTKSINFYRLSAINSCNKAITVSNTASNIVLTLEKINNDILLRWNKYMEWKGSVESYKILVNTGNNYTELSQLSSTDTSFILDYSEIMYDVSSGEVCFQVSADEKQNPLGIDGSTRSVAACTKSVEMITVPDVFTPNNDLINDLFKPVLSFTPVDYHLIISDRQGTVLFETRSYNESWNGSAKGDPVPQGVYLWYLKVTTPSGAVISKTGTIVVYFNR